MDILNGCMPHQNIIQLQIISKNSDYKIYKFKDILVDETRKVKKIKKADYLSKGKNPIVDQSKDFISGYTDCNDKIYKQYPYILFGDHTRVFKYINFESYLGADGAKIINVHEKYSEKIDIKYIYYFLKSVGIPDTGYNRHFKYVKSLLFPVPPMELQEKIVKVLDQAQALIDKRKEQIEALDQLIESIFYTMFGNPVRNEKGWEVKELEKVAPIKNHSINEEIESVWLLNLDMIESNSGVLKEKIYVEIEDLPSSTNCFSNKHILYSKLRPYLNKVFMPDDNGYCTSELVPLLPDCKLLNREYLLYLLRGRPALYYFNTHTSGARMPRVVMKDLKKMKISVPPLSLQKEFAQKVEVIEKQKELLNQSLELLEENYKSIMDKAFKGQLFN